MLRRMWDWLDGMLKRAITADYCFGCCHDWRVHSIEEITEKNAYLCLIRCTKCGKTTTEDRP